MLGLFRRMIKNRKGFTLIELLVVVVIIGVLATIAIQQLGDQSGKAKISKVKADIRTLESALEVYKIDTGNYPTALSVLVPNYIKKIPKDPWGADYVYSSGTVSSKGPDGEAGTSDDISL